MNKFFISILLPLIFTNASATDAEQIADKKKIYQIFNQIPGAASRISKSGIKLNYLFIHEIKNEDIESEFDRLGDIHYQFISTEPSKAFVSNVCRVLGGDLWFLKRDGKFIPEEKFSMWLMTGKCKTPDNP
jgi:hypothetical protein